MARYNWRISCDIQNKNLPHKKYNIDEREKSAYLIYGHTHLYLYQEKLESSCLLLSNVFIFAQNQHCTHKNQESYHLCKRVELYKLKYYFFFFLSIGSCFHLSELLKQYCVGPARDRQPRQGPYKLSAPRVAPFLLTTTYMYPILNKFWVLSIFSAGNHITFPKPHLAIGFSQQRYWNNIGFLYYEEPCTTGCSLNYSDLHRPG